MSSRSKKKAIRRPVKSLPQDEIDARRMVRHGITPQDLDRIGKQAFDEGFKASSDRILRSCYAAAALAYKRECERRGHEYTTALGVRFLAEMDEIISDTLTTAEIVESALEEAGVRVNFSELMPEDRIQEIT